MAWMDLEVPQAVVVVVLFGELLDHESVERHRLPRQLLAFLEPFGGKHDLKKIGRKKFVVGMPRLGWAML